MDWENQPDKFRRVLGSRSVDLPRSGTAATVPDGVSLWSLDALGVLLHDAAGITAWKSQGNGAKYSLRANPSSGALQPLEIFYFGAVGAEDPSQWHYNAYWHSLEYIAPLPMVNRWAAVLEQLPEGAALIGLTTIVWRNAWKYGDPGFRESSCCTDVLCCLRRAAHVDSTALPVQATLTTTSAIKFRPLPSLLPPRTPQWCCSTH